MLYLRFDRCCNMKQNSSRLAGNPNWGTATVVGIFAGMLYGGSKEASASVSKDAEVMLKMGSTQDKREQHRLMRDAMEKRFTRVTRGSLIGGMRLGMFTASFFSLQNFLAETRGVHDVFNVVGAGSATAAMFGLIMPGSLAWRARNVLLGSVLGATVCFPLGNYFASCINVSHKLLPYERGERGVFEIGIKLSASRIISTGWLQLKLMEKANEGNKEDTSHHGEVTSGVGAAIERLEQQLRK
ncbi:unnamed protein product [Thlaspi arvense]|uniref:Complex I assembly factor TIMMDC1, mitochondrial n=1 Tax=Thlaspi arvense TaxID=13288 RepID=A0AAU9RJP9_THLAR|nr:unnamed protein product [Thlaspi arvense]